MVAGHKALDGETKPVVVDLTKCIGDAAAGNHEPVQPPPDCRKESSKSLPESNHVSTISRNQVSTNDMLRSLLSGSGKRVSAAPTGRPPKARKTSARANTITRGPSKDLENARKAANDDREESMSVWTETHAPVAPADLIVHKKKVAEVQAWLEGQLAPNSPHCKMILVRGPAGCGKSATLRVLASFLGFTVVDWQAPALPTWDEIQLVRQGRMGVQYQTTLDAFADFAERLRMPALTVHEVGRRPADDQTKSQITFIDELPHVTGVEQRQKLAQILVGLARNARSPVVVFTIEMSGRTTDRSHCNTAFDGVGGLHLQILDALTGAGVPTITFNPITTLNTAKALHAVLEKEGKVLSEEQIMQIAIGADGDLRNALLTLQFACNKADQGINDALRVRKSKSAAATNKKATLVTSKEGICVRSLGYGLRDSSLDLFHGLGKLLYNKRVKSEAIEKKQSHSTKKEETAGGLKPAEWAVRAPMDGFTPESVLQTSWMEPSSVAAFLHENIPDFVDNDAIFDLAACLAQLSAADVLSASGGWKGRAMAVEDNGSDDATGNALSEQCAGLVAARGVCFWNTHPPPRRWQPLRGPLLYVAQKGFMANAQQVMHAAGSSRIMHGGAGGLNSRMAVATEILPALKLIVRSSKGGAAPIVLQQPRMWHRYWEGQLYEDPPHGVQNMMGDGDGTAVGGASSECLDDPIEDLD